jgi:prepilin-type N-terminal cleavage/methylation domain-containing protein/prepilin-type processing-associated H-X9-DG protein
MKIYWKVSKARASRQSGFTLIELLVVIAVIAILAALLLPALARAKGKTQSTACLNNVRQWGFAFYMYEDENDDFFPYEGTPSALDVPVNANAWYNSTANYMSQPTLLSLYQEGHPPVLGRQSVFVCPNGTNKTAYPSLARPVFYYGFNNYMDPNGSATFKRAEILFSTETVTFTENEEREFPSTWGAFAPARHDQRANLGFGDGHAAPVSYIDFHRKSTENTSSNEFSKPRVVYWWPYPGAPN